MKKRKVFSCGKIENYKLVVFGSGAVGKSSLIKRFVSGNFSCSYIPTVEDVYQYFLLLNNRLFNLAIVDTAGTHDFPAMKELSINESAAFILVFAVNDRLSFEHFKKDTLEVLQSRPDASMLVVGNKTDIQERTVSSLEVKDYLEKQQMQYPLFQHKYLETSAKSSRNVRQIFNETIKLLQPNLIPSCRVK